MALDKNGKILHVGQYVEISVATPLHGDVAVTGRVTSIYADDVLVDAMGAFPVLRPFYLVEIKL